MSKLNGDSEVINLKVPESVRFGLRTLTTLLGVIGTLGMGGFWLYADKHNAEMFLPREEYKRDQDTYRRDQQTLTLQLDKFDKSQDEMRKDIKELLKQRK